MCKDFKRKCELFSEQVKILNALLAEFKQKIIVQDLSSVLNAQVKTGRNKISDIDWLEETDINGDTFNLINKTEKKYYAYVVYTKKSYHTIGLGFLYKKELVSPHIESEVGRIIAKYKSDELDEISLLIDEHINCIKKDIEFLRSNPDIQTHEYFYGEYDKGFESQYRYETIAEVVEDYKQR